MAPDSLALENRAQIYDYNKMKAIFILSVISAMNSSKGEARKLRARYYQRFIASLELFNFLMGSTTNIFASIAEIFTSSKEIFVVCSNPNVQGRAAAPRTGHLV